MRTEREFIDGIAQAYFDEYTPDENARMFASIIVGDDDGVGDIFEDKKRDFRSLLQFRKYLKRLPKKYRKKVDFAGLERMIDSIDDTATRVERGIVSMEEVKEMARER
ncbi:hypothetical protein IJG04_00915 [Candidatus Saccharibacteria bacterium]|nr:hypothetical protein [Candidatus Saccharibacteria bacterium]